MSRHFFRRFMTRSSTNYRTALVAPAANDSIREAHHYEYDLNGNIVYVNTSSLSYCRKIHLSINQQVNMGLQVEHFITLAI